MKSNSLISRIIVGTILGITLFLVVLLDRFLLLIFLIPWIILSTKEFINILKIKKINLSPILVIFLNILFPVVGFLRLNWAFYLLFFLIIIIYGIFYKGPDRSLVFAYGLFTIFYLGFLPAHLLFLNDFTLTNNLPFWITLYPIFLTWINDTFAYFFGVLTGKHKLALEISPKKTYEGFIAGLISSILFSVVYLPHLLPSFSSLLATIYFGFIGLSLGVVAQLGDLVESVFKREAGLKDSSQALFGHGGFLDRIDSLLFTIPTFYYILIVIT